VDKKSENGKCTSSVNVGLLTYMEIDLVSPCLLLL